MALPTYFVALVDRDTGQVVMTVETSDPDWTREQMMRNRSPEKFTTVQIIDSITLNFS